jgi:hypothetical protein
MREQERQDHVSAVQGVLQRYYCDSHVLWGVS